MKDLLSWVELTEMKVNLSLGVDAESFLPSKRGPDPWWVETLPPIVTGLSIDPCQRESPEQPSAPTYKCTSIDQNHL